LEKSTSEPQFKLLNSTGSVSQRQKLEKSGSTEKVEKSEKKQEKIKKSKTTPEPEEDKPADKFTDTKSRAMKSKMKGLLRHVDDKPASPSKSVDENPIWNAVQSENSNSNSSSSEEKKGGDTIKTRTEYASFNAEDLVIDETGQKLDELISLVKPPEKKKKDKKPKKYAPPVMNIEKSVFDEDEEVPPPPPEEDGVPPPPPEEETEKENKVLNQKDIMDELEKLATLTKDL
jgi:hypothetical protein